MFSSLTAYLFGNSSGDTNNPSTEGSENQSNSTDQENSSDNIKLKVVPLETEEDEEDEDWLIVDKEEEEESLPQTDSEEEIPFVEIKRQQRTAISRYQCIAASGSALSINSDGIAHLAQGISQYGISMASCMGESWFLTPPPCFTSTGPIDMVISPFENLLIEHPSMSVYHRIRTVRQNPTDSDQTVAEYNFNFVQPEEPHPAEEYRPRRTLLRLGPIENFQNLTRLQTQETNLTRDAQKIIVKKSQQVLCRGAIKRGNNVREFNSKGGRLRRADMQHSRFFSGFNNNRKC